MKFKEEVKILEEKKQYKINSFNSQKEKFIQIIDIWINFIRESYKDFISTDEKVIEKLYSKNR